MRVNAASPYIFPKAPVLSFKQGKQHQEPVLPSILTSFRFPGAALTVVGISKSIFGGAKYMCRDIIHVIIPKKSCNNTRRLAESLVT